MRRCKVDTANTKVSRTRRSFVFYCLCADRFAVVVLTSLQEHGSLWRMVENLLPRTTFSTNCGLSSILSLATEARPRHPSMRLLLPNRDSHEHPQRDSLCTHHHTCRTMKR